MTARAILAVTFFAGGCAGPPPAGPPGVTGAVEVARFSDARAMAHDGGGRLYVIDGGEIVVMDTLGARLPGGLASAGLEPGETANALREFVQLVDQFRKRTAVVERLAAHHEDDPARHAEQMARQLMPAMAALRETGDAIESQVAADLWPLPTYRDLLFLK